MTLAATRSPLGAYYRSPLGVRARFAPAPAPSVWALDVGTISMSYSATWNLIECNQGSISFDGWRHAAGNVLTCAILNCEETGYRVRGRTSGVEAYMGVLEKGAGNCDLPCIIQVASGVYNEGGRGFWSGAPNNQWNMTCGTYQAAQLGFTQGERADLLITNYWTNGITQVEADAQVSVFPLLTLQNPHGLQPEMWVQIENSSLYDGIWRVFESRGANKLTLYNTVRDYAGDDTGTLRGKYDYKP